jgi:hypothetical protein
MRRRGAPMSLETAGLKAVMLDPPSIQEVLELAQSHDDQLKEARQDLLRAETRLRAEQTWKWLWRAVSLGLGMLALATLQNAEFQRKAHEAFAEFLAYAQTFMPGSIVLAGVEISLLIPTLLLFAGVAASTLFGVLIFREMPPRQVARKLMDQFVLHDGVTARALGEDSVAKVAAAVAARARPRRVFFRPRKATPVAPMLVSSVKTLLNRAAEAQAFARPNAMMTAFAPSPPLTSLLLVAKLPRPAARQ